MSLRYSINPHYKELSQVSEDIEKMQLSKRGDLSPALYFIKYLLLSFQLLKEELNYGQLFVSILLDFQAQRNSHTCQVIKTKSSDNGISNRDQYFYSQIGYNFPIRLQKRVCFGGE